MLELAGKLILSDGQTDELPLSQGIVWKPQVLDALTSGLEREGRFRRY